MLLPRCSFGDLTEEYLGKIILANALASLLQPDENQGNNISAG